MTEPLSLDQAKAHLRVLHDDEDDYLAGLVTAARVQAERDTGSVIVPRTVTLPFAAFASPLELKEAWPIAATPALAVSYLDVSGTRQTYAGARLFSLKWPALLLPALGASWPQTYAGAPDAVLVSLACGYADGQVPAPLVQAMRMLVAHWYERREAVTSAQPTEETPLGYRQLIASYRRIIV